MRHDASRPAGRDQCTGTLPYTPEEESIDELLGDDEEPDPLTPGDLWFRLAAGPGGGRVVYSPG